MKNKIAVEETLTNVRDYFIEKGYKVDSFSSNEISKLKSQDYDAVVISGAERDFLGISDTLTELPVIDASGMSAEAVFSNIVK